MLNFDQTNWRAIKDWAQKYFEGAPTKAVILFTNEYNDEDYSGQISTIILMDEDENELVPVRGKSVEARKNTPQISYYEEDEPPQDLVIDLTQWVEPKRSAPIHYGDHRTIKEWVAKYFPATAKKVMVMVASEYDDNVYENTISSILVFDGKDKELVPKAGMSVEARKHTPSISLRDSRQSYDEPTVIELGEI